MKLTLVFAHVFLTVGLAADSHDTCKDGEPAAQSRELLQQQDRRSQITVHELEQRRGRLHHFGEKKRLENAAKEATNPSSSNPMSGSSENMITFNDPPEPDPRLLGLRSWIAKELAKHPERELEARAATGAWDHPCGNASDPFKMAAIQETESPKIPSHMHFVLFLERADWINKTDPSRLISKESFLYRNMTGYEQLLIENMRYTMAMHKDMKSVHFMDDEACKHVTGKFSAEFLHIYEDEGDLRFKSDICRLAALYWEGGYHFDDDMLTYNQVTLQDDIDISTVLGVTGRGMFQSFLAAAPCHPVLARNIQMMIDARKDPVPEYLIAPFEAESWLLGPVTLKLAWDEKKPSHGQLLYESQEFQDTDRQPSGGGFSPCAYVVMDRNASKLLYCSRV